MALHRLRVPMNCYHHHLSLHRLTRCNRQLSTLSPLATSSLASTSTMMGDSHGIVHTCLDYVHVMAGMPWWGCIVSATILLRCLITGPSFVYSQHITARRLNVQSDNDDWNHVLKHEVLSKLRSEGKTPHKDEVIKRLSPLIKKKRNEIYRAANAETWRLLAVPFLQMPLWVSVSLALRDMSGHPALFFNPSEAIEGFSTGGMLWFTNLTIPDPTLGLPIIIASTNYINMELNMLRRKTDNIGRMQEFMIYAFRLGTVAMIPLASFVPSAVALYWASSSIFSVGVNLMVRYPTVRRAVNIPVTKQEAEFQGAISEILLLFKNTRHWFGSIRL